MKLTIEFSEENKERNKCFDEILRVIKKVMRKRKKNKKESYGITLSGFMSFKELKKIQKIYGVTPRTQVKCGKDLYECEFKL